MRSLSPLTFSIAVPALGQAEFLATGLASLRSQRAAIQLAVLDASPDDRVQQVLREEGLPLAYAYHHADAGQAAAIQEGWDRTTGDIVSWLCADDYLFPDTLSTVADEFRAHPDVDVVFGHAVHVSETGVFQGYFPSTDPKPEALVRGCSISQPACFVRRSAMERVGGLNTELHYTMDWDFWLRLHGAGCRFRFIDSPLAAIRVHAKTKTLSGGRRRRQEIASLLKSHRVAPMDRWRAQLAFWRQDLLQDQKPSGLRQGLDLAAALERRVRPKVRSIIRGLESGTNCVEAGCVVRLPWYAPAPPREAIVMTDRPVGVTVTINDRPASLEPLGLRQAATDGRDLHGHGYRLHFELPPSEVLSFRFDGTEPWRLLGLAVH